MKKLTAFLGVIAFAAMIFAGASSALAAEPLYFKVTITGKGYLVDDDNETESKASFKTTGYLMWLGDAYVLVTECPHGKGGWYPTNDTVETGDSGNAIYIADEQVDICIPNGFAGIRLTARIGYKVKDMAVASAMFTSLGAQITEGEINGEWGTIVGGAQVKGKTIAFDKLPEAVQDIFECYPGPC